MKKYIAKSDVAVCVTFADGSHKHIKFFPKTNGGSVYYTDNKDEQDALEAHARYGKLYKIDETAVEVEAPAAPVAPAQDAVAAAPEAMPLTEITVTDLAAAKDYLCDRFGISRTKLRSTNAIFTAAGENGIKFIGI